MPAISEEVEQALEEGAKLITMAAPLRLVTDKTGKLTGLEVAKTIPGKHDSKGRRVPVVTKDTYIIPCDAIIKAIGEKPDSTLQLGFDARKVDPWTLQTSNPKVYAGGDYVSGAANVATAMGYGKKAAKQIDRALTGLDRFEELWPKFEYDQTIPPPSQGGARNPARAIPPEQRVGNTEVSPTFTEWQAKAECLRCLRCDIKETR
jgi:NADH-quinone oxidoreductase subunit F